LIKKKSSAKKSTEYMLCRRIGRKFKLRKKILITINKKEEIKMYLDKEEVLCEEIHGIYVVPPDWP